MQEAKGAAVPFQSVAKRDRDRARYVAQQQQRRQRANQRSHKRGFGTMGGRFA